MRPQVKNIIEQIKTTVIGLAFLVFAGAFFWQYHENLLQVTGAGAAAIVGVILLFAEDEQLDKILNFFNKQK